MENIPNGYIILKEIAEKILENKDKVQTLSYPAKRVLYAGRTTGKWYTKSKQVHDEIMNLYKGMDNKRKKQGKPKSEVSASDLGVSEEELQRFLALMEKLLIRKG